MCGIIAYIGNKKASNFLLDGLKRLEYRGYDSAGLAIYNGQKINTLKASGRIINLANKLSKKPLKGNIGIAHTRWATHGQANTKNAHPHSDCSGQIWLVHNGIIENYQQLKKWLAKNGHSFSSQTDTEVIAHLIEEFYNGDLLAAVRKALSLIKGTYGLVVMHSLEPKRLIAARMSSPLLLGVGSKEVFVCSDAAAILPFTRDVIYLEDGEIAEIYNNKINIFDANYKKIKKEPETIKWNIGEAEKGGFKHFMEKEIFEQPESAANTLRGRINTKEYKANLGGFIEIKDKLSQLKYLVLIGCGTAHCAAQIGEYMIEELACLPTKTEYASEFHYRTNVLPKNTAILAISQSGETADTLAAIRKAKEKGLLTLGVVNVVGSTIAREVDAGIYTYSGPEIAVASTKAFTSQLIALALMALLLGKNKLSTKQRRLIVKELESIPQKIKETLKVAGQVKKIAKKYYKYKNFAFLGRKFNCPIAQEGAIKLKEISYIHAEGFPSGEMKHGPIAMIDKNFPSIFIMPQTSVYEKNLSNAEEIKARGGLVIAVASHGDRKTKKIADDIIYIPKTLEFLTPILSVIPLQLLAYYIAIYKKRNVDKPRNLAKSVTVE